MSKEIEISELKKGRRFDLAKTLLYRRYYIHNNISIHFNGALVINKRFALKEKCETLQTLLYSLCMKSTHVLSFFHFSFCANSFFHLLIHKRTYVGFLIHKI